MFILYYVLSAIGLALSFQAAQTISIWQKEVPPASSDGEKVEYWQNYHRTTWGDCLCCSLVNACILDQFHLVQAWMIPVALGIGIVLTWNFVRHTYRNIHTKGRRFWTIRKCGRFTFAGWWHKVCMVILLGFGCLAFLMLLTNIDWLYVAVMAIGGIGYVLSVMKDEGIQPVINAFAFWR